MRQRGKSSRGESSQLKNSSDTCGVSAGPNSTSYIRGEFRASTCIFLNFPRALLASAEEVCDYADSELSSSKLDFPGGLESWLDEIGWDVLSWWVFSCTLTWTSSCTFVNPKHANVSSWTVFLSHWKGPAAVATLTCVMTVSGLQGGPDHCPLIVGTLHLPPYSISCTTGTEPRTLPDTRDSQYDMWGLK